MRLPRAVVAVAAAAVVLISLQTSTLPTATAETPGTVGQQALQLFAPFAGPPPAPAPAGGARLVVLGDSIASGTNLPMFVDSRRCPQGYTGWPQQLAAGLGLAGTPDFVDQACIGGTLDSPPNYRLADQARAADSLGAFGPRTEDVLLQFGFNDVWGTPGVRAIDAAGRCWFNLIQGCDLDAVAQGRAQDPAAVTPAAYANRMRQVVTYIRYYAPNARITLVGYPELRPPQPDAICLGVLGLSATNPRGAAYVRYLDALQSAQVGAAQELGLTFVDLRAATAGHGPCTAQSWIDGILDVASHPFGAPFHLTPLGESVATSAIRDGLRR